MAGFFCELNMALLYQYDQEIAKYQAKTTATSNYRSDQKAALFGGRGGRDREIAFLSANTKLSDGWQAFASAQGMTGSRANESRRKFFEETTFP